MRKLVLLPILALFVACGDSTGPGDESHVGTFRLESVDGDPLPFVLTGAGADRVEVASGSITLDKNGSFNDEAVFRVVAAGQTSTESETVAGTYARNLDEITFTASDGSRYSASYTSPTLTMVRSQLVVVYRR